LSFQSRPSGGGGPDTPVTFVIRYAHPTGRLVGAQQKALCLCKEGKKGAGTLKKDSTL
jgi:hypothetical protein